MFARMAHEQFISFGGEIDDEQVHPAVCSASCGMHLVYLYMNQVFISILFG